MKRYLLRWRFKPPCESAWQWYGGDSHWDLREKAAVLFTKAEIDTYIAQDAWGRAMGNFEIIDTQPNTCRQQLIDFSPT